MINDEQALKGAKNEFGREIPIYDDGTGPLWIHRNSTGIKGIVRAETLEVAFGICEDEFFPEASETIDEIRAEYNKRRDSVRIVRETHTGIERDARAEDFPLGLGVQFVRWETRETPAEEGEEIWPENGLFQEAFGFRPSGPNTRDKVNHGIYAKDLNGDDLNLLTPELAEVLGVTLEITQKEDDM